MKPERRLIEKALGTPDRFDDRCLRDAVQLFFLLLRQVLRRVNNDGQILVFVPDFFDQLEARHVGQHQVEDHAIDPLAA